MNPNEQNNNQQPANDSYGQLPQNQPLPTQQPINGSVPLGQPQVQAVPMQSQPMVINNGSNPLQPLGGAVMNNAQSSAPMMSGNTVALKKGRKKLLIISSLSFLVLAGGAVAAYMLFFAKPTPQKVLASVWGKTLGSDSAILEIATKSSSADVKVKNNILNNAISSEFNINARGKDLNVEVRMPDLKKFAIYFKLAKLKEIVGSISPEMAGSFKDDQWFVVNDQTIKGLSDKFPKNGRGSKTVNRSVQDNYTDAIKLFGTISGSIKKHSLMTFKKELASEDAGSESSYHYEVMPSKDDLKAVLAEIKNSNNGLFAELSIDEWNKAEDSINKADYSKTFEVWIGKKSGKLRKVRGYNDNAKKQAIDYTLSDAVGSTKVEEPKDAQNLLDIFNSFYGGVQGRGKDTERRTDVNAMATSLEVYYNDNSGYPSYNDMKSDVWVTKNMPGIDQQGFIDPSGKRLGQAGGEYTYSIASSAAGCVSPTNATGSKNSGKVCDHFNLSVMLDSGGLLTKNSLN